MEGHEKAVTERARIGQRIPYVKVGNHLTRVDFMNPKPEQIRILDIALHLAKQCRFLGAVPTWYSNAEHSILGSYMSSDIEVQRQFLIHDTGEYVYGDVPSPVGRLHPTYKADSHRFQLYLLKHFCGVDEFHPEVKVIDDKITSSEQLYLRGATEDDLWADAYPEGMIRFYEWEWREALKEYMHRFYKLFPNYKDAK